ncbi:hypothetical protein BSM4216_1221 [Bacillus smithii]|nr:hypothetical protein BSM4216_1221 [Bacillus smithii]
MKKLFIILYLPRTLLKIGFFFSLVDFFLYKIKVIGSYQQDGLAMYIT